MTAEKYKPLSFSTTMRNPERIPAFLECLQSFENKILTNDLIDKIVKKVISRKLYKPNYIKYNPYLNSIYKDEDGSFSSSQLDEIVANSMQRHKETGFDYGWPSRFDTWYKLAMEFGFIYYEIDKPLRISQLGHTVINAVSGNGVDDKVIQNAFLNVLSKYQTKNPFRKIKNSNIPLILFLQVVKMLHDNDSDARGIHRLELPLFICWRDDDALALYTKIQSLRNTYGFAKYTDELIYEECLGILGYDNGGKSYVKMSKVVHEAPDEYIRKMRITGVVSLRGHGRFLDWNTLEIEKINYLLSQKNECHDYKDKVSFFEYMSAIDRRLFKESESITDINELRQATLRRFADEYEKDFVFGELKKVCNKKESADSLLKYIPGPVRLEFLTSIALTQNYKNLSVKPNYSVDDEGLPTSTAKGGLADIECVDDKKELVEVTLMRDTKQQVASEMIAIDRHLQEAKGDRADTFAIFIAPRIHPDAERYSQWVLERDALEIQTFSMEQFIQCMKQSASLSTIADYKPRIEYALHD